MHAAATMPRAFAALAEPNRFRIVELLLHGPRSTSGRAGVGIEPCTRALYVSLIMRCDSAAMVPNTSESRTARGRRSIEGRASPARTPVGQRTSCATIVTTSKTLHTTGMAGSGTRPIWAHARAKQASWTSRQYSSEPSPSPSIAAYSASTPT